MLQILLEPTFFIRIDVLFTWRSTTQGNTTADSILCNIGVKYTSMQTRVRFGQLGAAHGQFNSPHGFCLGIDEDIVVADTNNHRIQVMKDDQVDFNS